jgi:hypothetical protein
VSNDLLPRRWAPPVAASVAQPPRSCALGPADWVAQWGPSLGVIDSGSAFPYLFLKTWGWTAVPVSLELLQYFLGWPQTIPYSTRDLETSPSGGGGTGYDSKLFKRLSALSLCGCAALTPRPLCLSSVAPPPSCSSCPPGPHLSLHFFLEGEMTSDLIWLLSEGLALSPASLTQLFLHLLLLPRRLGGWVMSLQHYRRVKCPKLESNPLAQWLVRTLPVCKDVELCVSSRRSALSF